MEDKFQRKDVTLDSSINELHLPERQYDYLCENGIDTIGKLLEKNTEDLMQIKGFNSLSLKIVKSKLMEYGLKLKEAPPKNITINSYVEELNMKNNVECYFRENNIFYISDLLKYTLFDIARLKIAANYKTGVLGIKRANMINRKLDEYGFSLKKSEEEYISEMPIRENICNILNSNRINTVKQLTEMTLNDLLKITGIGDEYAKEIQNTLGKDGKHLKEGLPEEQVHKEILKRRKKLNPRKEREGKIKKLNLQSRTYNKLMRQGIDTIEKLLSYSYSDLIKIKGIGKIAIDEINNHLADSGFEKIKK